MKREMPIFVRAWEIETHVSGKWREPHRGHANFNLPQNIQKFRPLRRRNLTEFQVFRMLTFLSEIQCFFLILSIKYRIFSAPSAPTSKVLFFNLPPDQAQIIQFTELNKPFTQFQFTKFQFTRRYFNLSNFNLPNFNLPDDISIYQTILQFTRLVGNFQFTR